jgi:hypothetical protein
MLQGAVCCEARSTAVPRAIGLPDQAMPYKTHGTLLGDCSELRSEQRVMPRC